MPPTDPPPLVVEHLGVSFATAGGREVAAVTDVSLTVAAGEFVALVGESGSGKTVTARALLGLHAPGARVEGRVMIRGRDIGRLARRDLERLRGAEVAMVFQQPMTTLNPVLSVGRQLRDAIVAHQPLRRRAATQRAVELLDLVGLPRPRRTFDAYPHQLSGGMQQRVGIALAVAHEPALIVADEPTTALDVTIQAQVMELLDDVRRACSAAVLLISHDLGLVARRAERVLVMYAGQLVESGPTAEVLAGPRAPYTAGLLASSPTTASRRALTPIPGAPPLPGEHPPGCRFAPRCPHRIDRCEFEPPVLRDAGIARQARCLRLEELGALSAVASDRDERPAATARVVLQAAGLRTSFRGRRAWPWSPPPIVRAVDGVDLELRRRETLAVVGESGSGKTTLGRTLVRLLEPDAGTIHLDDRDITHIRGRALRALRGRLQLVFQDPLGALNPRRSIARAIAEPLRLHARPHDRAAVAALAERVGIGTALLDRRPPELSGGQLQRVGIARALAVDPEVVVLDEPVSALDVSVQAQILALLEALQAQTGVGYLLISHDLAVVRHLADRVLVLYLGRVVEQAPATRLFALPAHPYTHALLSAIPRLEDDGRPVIVCEGDRPDPADPPAGCRFHPRCPLAQDRCRHEEPSLVTVDGPEPEHRVACHFPVGPDGLTGH